LGQKEEDNKSGWKRETKREREKWMSFRAAETVVDV